MDNTKEQIQEQLQKIHEDITAAEQKSGRPAGSVQLLAVSKFHPCQSVLDAMDCGQLLFGENRVQEAKAKFLEVREKGFTPQLHIIGSLQRNKIKDAVKIADCIESVDRIEVLQDIEKHCANNDKTIKVLFEFHTGEESKSGFATYDDLLAAVGMCANGLVPHVIPTGFMTMAPLTQDESAIHASFSLMRTTAEKIKKEFPQLDMPVLSMGMSGDYKIAIEEGSTEVRIGTAIFGERDYTRT